jgi:hypothetical protein
MAAIGKVADELLEQVGVVGKGDALAAETARAAEGAKRARRRNLDAELDDLVAQHKATKDLNAKPQEELDNILAKQEEQKVVKREEDLFTPAGDPFVREQTLDAVEFRRRLHEQLANPEYAASIINTRGHGIDLTDVPEDFEMTTMIKKQNFNENLFQRMVNRGFKKDKRRMAAALEWLGDSPYVNADGSPRVMVHVDSQSDVVRGTEDFIQLQKPREAGIHSGTNAAAIKAGLRDVDDATYQFEQFDEFVDEVSSISQYDPKDIRGMIVEAMDKHFFQKFSDDPDSISTAQVWEDVRQVLSEAITDVGGDAQEVTKFIGKAKQLKTANSTPHLFRGKNGLYMRDRGGFTTGPLLDELLEIFPKKEAEILALRDGGGSNTATQQRIQSFIEDQGFDHIVYHNTVEDVGSLSIINWNEDLFMPLFDPQLAGNNPASIARQASAYFLGVLGISSQMPDEREQDGV